MLISMNTDAFMRSWEGLQRRMDENIGHAWDQAGEQARDAQKEHGYQNKTGSLTASMQWRARRRGKFRYAGYVITRKKYAKWIDQGTGLYGPRKQYIRPKKANFLRFYWDKAGGIVYARRVRGVKPAKFSEQATEKFSRVAPHLMQRAVDAAARYR